MRFLLLVMAGSSVLLAQEAELPPVKAVEVPARIGVLGSVTIALPEVIQKVLASDRDLAISRILREEASYNVKGARGVYDPRLGLNASRLKSVAPVTSLIGGSANGKLTTESYVADPQLSGLFPALGGSYKLDFSSSRQASDSTFLTLNPQYPTSLNFSVTQPLLRGLLYDDNRHRIAVAKKNVQLTDEQFRQRVTDVVTQAVQAYWELDFAYRNLQVQTQAVTLAGQQDASNRRQVTQGLLAPSDVVATQTQLATFQQNVFAAQQTLTVAENNLKSLMLPDRTDLMWGMALQPEYRTDPRAALPALDDAVKAALAARPERAQSQIALEVNQLDARLSREQARAQIDAVASVSAVGVAGRVLPPQPNPFTAGFVPLIAGINALNVLAGLPPLVISSGTSAIAPVFVGGYGQSLSVLGSRDYTTAQFGVQVSFPLRNRTAQAQMDVAGAEGRRLKAQQQQIEIAIELDVRNALQAVSSARGRLDAATTAREYAERQYGSEQRQFQAGTSTVFLVLQRQTDLIAARTREVRARADSGQASASLDRATARTIEAQGISLR